MRLLDRYLLRELLVPLAYCLGGFLIFWIAFDLFGEVGEYQERNLNILDVLEFYLVKTPEMLSVVLPVALLLALLYALTNHARCNELTAMRAAGTSLWRLSVPYLAVGILFSAALLAISELWVPQSTARLEQILNRRHKITSAVQEW
jgi:lipopolysaccharide export system permease protein